MIGNKPLVNHNEYMRKYRTEHPEYREYMRKYSKANKARIYANHNRRNLEHPERAERLAKKREQDRIYREKNAEKIRIANAKYRAENPEKRREMVRASQKRNWMRRHLQRLETDANYAIKFRCACRIRSAVKRNGATKTGRTVELIGCTIPELRRHLEKQFRPGMSWENFGEWQIDHKIPCAEFDLRHELQQLQCFNYKNLQPLWRKDNIQKGAKLLYSYQKTLPI